MDRLIVLASAALMLASCTKNFDNASLVGEDTLIVEVEEATSVTKSILSGTKGTVFTSGDKIKVYDTQGKSAVYKYRTVISGEVYFQKESGDDDFDKTKFESAFYPADSVDSYSSKTYTAHFGASQTYAEGSFPSGSAPMISFSKSGDKVTFSNCFAVVRFAFKYSAAATNPVVLDTIALTAASSTLYGSFQFSSSGTTRVASTGDKTVNLVGCSAAGALGTTEKYFYLAVPGITSTTAGETMTIKATPTTDVPFTGTFQASKTGTSTNKIDANYILQMKSFVLKPIETGGSSNYTLADWDSSTGNIQVGQITLATSEVSIQKGANKRIQIFGVTDWSKISVKTLSGDCFTPTLEQDSSNPPSVKYYVKITASSSKTGNGEVFVNDQVTNSGSYIDITVTK